MLRAIQVLALAGTVLAASGAAAEAKRASHGSSTTASHSTHSTTAHSKPKPKPKSKSKHPKSKHPKSRKHHHHAHAHAKQEAHARPRGNNMPPGFVWPASDAMRAAGTACETELGHLGVTWQTAPALGKVPDPIHVPAMLLGGIQYTSYYRPAPFTMDCELARTLETFGPELYALGVRTIKFGSIYRNTNVRVGGVTKPFLSRHALGFVMDIVSFTDATGREAVVKTDYKQGDVLLLAIEDHANAAGLFRTVLTPKNDPISHSDHFHIEVAVDYTKAP